MPLYTVAAAHRAALDHQMRRTERLVLGPRKGGIIETAWNRRAPARSSAVSPCLRLTATFDAGYTFPSRWAGCIRLAIRFHAGPARTSAQHGLHQRASDGADQSAGTHAAAGADLD